MSLIGVPLPGSVLAGKYLVEGVLGTGGMGVVLAARHEQLDQRVAIKLLLQEARQHPEVVERFSREARAAAKIQGEHVARVIDVGLLEGGAPYIVMEYLEGRDLAAELKARGPLPARDVVRWILEACEAIAQAHAAKIVHRDLKPGNLFLARQPDGQSLVKVLDFGISKSVDPNAPALTKTSSIVGTPYYMAPEQLRAAKSVDARADIWAIGVIMYELIAGGPPFDGQQMPEIVAAILTNQPAPIDSIRQGLPPGLGRAIARCIQSAPDERFPNVAALAFALAPFASSNEEPRVKRIARVLGVADPEEEPTPDTEVAPPAAQPTPPGVSGVAKTVLMEATSQPDMAGPPLMSALATTKAVSELPATAPSKPEISAAKSIAGDATSSASAEERRPATGKFAALAAAAIAVGAGAFVLLARREPPPAATIVATATNVASSSSPPAESAAALPTASVSAEPPPKAATSESAPTSTAVGSAPSAKISASPRSTAKTAPSTSTARSAAASATTPAKNPLDMGIK